MGLPIEALEWRELCREARPGELIDALGHQQVLKPMCTQIPQVVIRREVIGEKAARGFGEKHLIAIAGRQDPGQTVQTGGQVVAIARRCFTDVDRHAHTQGTEMAPVLGGKSTLASGGGGDGSGNGGEGRLHGVANGLEENTVLGRNGRVEQREVTLDHRPHRRGIALPARGAALDIGEEEGDGT